jgi:hypothetical protein
MKLLRTRDQLSSTMGWVEDFSAGTIKMIGTLEILAAVGLVLPGLTGIAPVLTPLAASGLVLLMIGAATAHMRRREWGNLVPVALLGGMAAVVAWGRFGAWPL